MDLVGGRNQKLVEINHADFKKSRKRFLSENFEIQKN